jgi:hypothetical protein
LSNVVGLLYKLTRGNEMSDSAKVKQYTREATETREISEWAGVTAEWAYITKAAEEANSKR